MSAPAGIGVAPRVGIADSGVAPDRVSVDLGRDFTGRPGDPSVVDELGHGTPLAELVVAGCQQAILVVARIFGRRRAAAVGQVVTALDWLVEQHVQIINLSFGIPEANPELAAACQRAAAAGVVLVASAPARGRPTFPAAYPCCLSVSGDARCRPGEISWLGTTQAEFGAHPLLNDDGPPVGGASYATARVSGMVAALLAKGCPAASIRDALKAQACHLGPERRQA